MMSEEEVREWLKLEQKRFNRELSRVNNSWFEVIVGVPYFGSLLERIDTLQKVLGEEK